jgi:hypothetical protein
MQGAVHVFRPEEVNKLWKELVGIAGFRGEISTPNLLNKKHESVGLWFIL